MATPRNTTKGTNEMSNLIAFLDSLGRTATVSTQGDDFTAAVKAAELDDRAEAALLAGDTATLAQLLGARPTMICALMPADDEQPVTPDDGDEPADDEKKEAVGRFGRH